MSEWHRAVAAEDVPIGSGKELTIAGRIVALYHTEDGFHAIDGICAHAGGPLGQGVLNRCIVTCPWHGWQYDVTTGRHCLTDSIRQQSFAVKIDGDDVYVELP